MTHKLHTAYLALACWVAGMVLAQSAWAAPAQSSAPNFAAVDGFIASHMKDLRIPGLALAVVHGDQVVYLKGYGQADPTGRAVTPQTPFMLASITKPLTALAIMQLVQAGQVDLDAPVQRYLPWFQVADSQASSQTPALPKGPERSAGASVTVRELLYHTSGLSEGPELAYAGVEDLRPDALELRVRALANVPLAHPAGTTYEYSNANYQILGLIIQQVTGQSYESYLQAHVFQPLGMAEAYTAQPDAAQHGLATGYRFWFGLPVPDRTPFDRGGLPSGFVMASAEDMAHFLVASLNGGRYGDASVLSPEMMAELLRPAGAKPGGDESYAMDWGVMNVDGEPWIIKGGDLSDFKTQLVMVPGVQWGVVTLINANNSLDSFTGDLRLPFIPLQVTRLLLGHQLGTVPASPLPNVMRAVPVLIVALELAGILRSISTLRRWRATTDNRPRGWRGVSWRIGAPFLANLLIGLAALAGVPQLLRLPLSFLLYMTPDFGYTLAAAGVLGLGWSGLWLILASNVLRTAIHPDALVLGAPLEAS